MNTRLSILTLSLCCLLLTGCAPGSRAGNAPASTPTRGNEVRTHGPVAAPAPHASVAPRFTVPDTLDAWIEREMERRRIPGLSLAIARAGEVLAVRAYGLADVQNQVPVSPATRFDLASLTKAFTAAGILLLVDDGRIDLDAPISTYLNDAPENWAGVTTRHLLNHTSGLPIVTEAFHGRGESRTWSTQEMYEFARGESLSSPPGEVFRYSPNFTYFLLGVITQEVSGIPWREFIHSRIFDALGMSDSYVPWDRRQENEARTYTLREGEWVRIRDGRLIEMPSHAGVFSNVLDLVKWDAALHDDRLLSEEARKAMWTPARLSDGSAQPYGLGWNLWCQRGHAVHQHTGISGTEMIRLPGDTLMVVVLTNLGIATSVEPVQINPWGIAPQIAEMIVPAIAPPSGSQRLSESELEQIVGEYRYVGIDPTFDPAARLETADGELRLRDSGGPVVLYSISSDVLAVAGEPYAIVIERNHAGRVDAWRLHHMYGVPSSGAVRTHADCAGEAGALGALVARAVRVADP